MRCTLFKVYVHHEKTALFKVAEKADICPLLATAHHLGLQLPVVLWFHGLQGLGILYLCLVLHPRLRLWALNLQHTALARYHRHDSVWTGCKVRDSVMLEAATSLNGCHIIVEHAHVCCCLILMQMPVFGELVAVKVQFIVFHKIHLILSVLRQEVSLRCYLVDVRHGGVAKHLVLAPASLHELMYLAPVPVA